MVRTQDESDGTGAREGLPKTNSPDEQKGSEAFLGRNLRASKTHYTLSPEQQKKQIYYRDARTGGYYDGIWKTVGKCVFCDLRDKYIVYEENGMVLVVALYAYIDGDTMIIPRRHIKSAKELTPSEWETTRKIMYIAKKILRKTYGLQDVQYILRDGGLLVGSTVQDHFHMHCVPSDGPDLTVWNYRKLKYTPFENAELLRTQSKTIKRLAARFDQKYREKPDEL